MSIPEIELQIYARAIKAQSIEQRHAEVMGHMAQIESPLGFKTLELPSAPDCGSGLAGVYGLKLSTRGLRFIGSYVFRGDGYAYMDSTIFDDSLRYGFKVTNKSIDYQAILHKDLAKIIEAFRGYRAIVDYDYHALYYTRGGNNGYGADGYAIETNSVYSRLRADSSVNMDGRHFIYILYPAQYWDAELCRRALGYGPDEVIARLQGRVPRVERLMDGVYTVLNDNPMLSYADFVAMNETIKPILGLV